jgi:hypothetical protein
MPPPTEASRRRRALGNLIKVDKKGYPMNWGNLSASE